MLFGDRGWTLEDDGVVLGVEEVLAGVADVEAWPGGPGLEWRRQISPVCAQSGILEGSISSV